MTPADLENLERWCDGTLVSTELAAWTARVADDPALQAEIANERRFVNYLRASATPPADRIAAASEAAVRSRALILADRHTSRAHTVAQVMAGTRRRSWIRWWPAVASAAAACLMITWYWTTSTAVAWSNGSALRAGVDLPTTARDVQFADHSAIAITANSRVRLGEDAQRKRIELLAGGIDAIVAPQTADTSFTIATLHGEATVLGTQFRVDLAEDSSIFSVSEGRVAVRSGDASLTATAGQRAIAANGTVVFAPPPWTDHRPLGRVVISGSMGSTGHQPAGNPNGWLFDPTIDRSPAGFNARMTAAVDQMIAGLASVHGQGLMLYAIEGGAHQHSVGFLGDPRRVKEFAPEFDAIADALFARIRAAGLSTGVTISPWRLAPYGNTLRKVIDPATAESELDSKITYARQRWGCSVFYINVVAPGQPSDVHLPAAALRAVALRHPDVLLIAENPTIAHTAVAAGQALRDELVPPGRAVARLPWYGANPTPAALAAAIANGDILVFDPLIDAQVNALRALTQPRTP
jgi:ferric-dicitrate binding protein FerR (iron transport regulator)